MLSDRAFPLELRPADAYNASTMIGAPVFCRRFMAREEELGLLHDRYGVAAGGRGSMVLVGGEAGVGKTRFLDEVRAQLTARGARFTFAAALEHTESPLGPIVAILQQLDEADPAILQREPTLRTALAPLFPGLLVESRDSLPTALADARRGQFAAIVEALQRFTTDATIVVALDDMQWADVATLDFLQYAVEKIATFRLVFLIAYRSDELHRRHPLTPVIGKLERRDVVWRISLTQLSESDTRAFIHATLEDRGPLDAETIREIVKLSEGNPLFIEELVKHALEARRFGRGNMELPLSIRHSVLERLTEFAEDERSVLMHAAVLGRHFDAEFLARVEGRPLNEITSVLRRARDAQLIIEQREAALRFGFRHALIREAVYSELLAAEARPLHARIAAALEERADAEERLIEVAYHWWAARNPEKAANANERAGDLAARRLAHESAATFFERALEFVSDPLRQAQLYEKLGEVLRIPGLPEQSRRAFKCALAYYHEHGPWDKVVELSLHIARQYFLTGHTQESLTLREQTLEMVREHPEHAYYFAAFVGIANHHALRGDLEQAEKYLDQADRSLGARELRHVVSFEDTAGLAALLRGDWIGAKAHYERAIALAHNVADPLAEVQARSNLGYVATTFGDWEAAIECFESTVELARARFVPGHEAYALAGYAAVRYLTGDLQSARTLIDQALSVVEEVQAYLRLQLAGIAIPLGLRLGDEALVDRFAREENVELAFRSDQAQRIAPIGAAFAELYVQRGQKQAAIDLLHRVVCTIPSVAQRPWWSLALAQYGSPEDQPGVRALLVRWAAHSENRAGKAYLALYDALLATDAAGARECGERAELAFAELHMPHWQALALELSRRPLEALELYRKMGDRMSIERLENVLAAPNRRGRTKNELTEREREVAALVASGKSTRAVATMLTISERTVDTHLASIFSKLGVGSRAEVAALLAREPLH